MQIIPVIDLLNGVVVHAKKGERQHYQAIESQLTVSSDPLDIIAALLDLYPFTQLYIADLNAIQKSESSSSKKNHSTNYSAIKLITECFPTLTFWLDAGISNNAEFSIWQQLNVRLVIGSENFTKIDHYRSLNVHKQSFILSLDFMSQGYQGPTELLTNTSYWPQDVIVMSLPNVGTNQGVNTDLLSTILANKGNSNVYAAGGIRDDKDLLLLKAMDVHGALIATALHQKQISSLQLKTLAK